MGTHNQGHVFVFMCGYIYVSLCVCVRVRAYESVRVTTAGRVYSSMFNILGSTGASVLSGPLRQRWGNDN